MENREIDPKKTEIGRFVPVQRLPYRSLALVEYGNVAKLTQRGGGSGDGAGRKLSCL